MQNSPQATSRGAFCIRPLLTLPRSRLSRRRLGLRNNRLGRASWGRLGLADALDAASVERHSLVADRLKEELVADDLHEHERIFAIVAVEGQLRFPQVALPQLSRRANDEVGDAFLRLDALVEVLVSGDHDVDAMFDEHRLEQIALQLGGAVRLA